VRETDDGNPFSVSGKWFPSRRTFFSPEADLFGRSRRFGREFVGIEVAQIRSVPIDVVLGRALAWCANPYASWRRLPASGRVWLVAAYVSASYVTVLTLLLIS
jgi:hypothetical protein